MIDRAALAARWDAQLRASILPFWRRTVDDARGGYLVYDRHPTLRGGLRALGARGKARLARRLHGTPLPRLEKHLVSQTRLVWTFSLAHRLGYDGRGDENLRAADHGYRFIEERMRDAEHGGYYWTVDLEGRPRDPRKVLYGLSFAIYALVEYHRASGGLEPLVRARQLFELVQARLRDGRGAWIEHVERDFGPLQDGAVGATRGLPDLPGFRSSNAHLHWMEALSELLEATGDAAVRTALEEAVAINRWFFPRDPARGSHYRTSEGERVDEGLVAYGHNLEFGWLLLRAHEVLGTPPDRDHFQGQVRHALDHGFDHRRGGVYFSGFKDRPANRREKVWWVQAESLIALLDALRHRPDAEVEQALDRLLEWIVRCQELPDGVWVYETTPRGRIRSFIRASSWKAAYHEVRALTRFIADHS